MKKKMYFKKVLMPVKVSAGVFCFGDGECCEHFSNEGGNPRCRFEYVFGFWDLKSDDKGRVLKPVECRDLKDAD